MKTILLNGSNYNSIRRLLVHFFSIQNCNMSNVLGIYRLFIHISLEFNYFQNCWVISDIDVWWPTNLILNNFIESEVFSGVAE